MAIDFTLVEPKTKIIWDSGFGYEIGYFTRISDEIMYNTVIVELITGSQIGSAMRSKDSIKLYNDETLNMMVKKYHYFNEFPTGNKFVNCTN